MTQTRWLGASLVLYAFAFNAPYVWLAANFDYPAILRRPAGEILHAFAAGGTPLVLAWAAFMLAALALAPLALALARLTGHGAGVTALGIAAALAQAIGLSRWTFVTPGLAAAWRSDAAARTTVEATFATLHQFAGVGIGETIGQVFTAFWLIGVAAAQARTRRALAALAALAAVLLLAGQAEGLATAIAFNPGPLVWSAPLGFLAVTAWLIATGCAAFAADAPKAETPT